MNMESSARPNWFDSLALTLLVLLLVDLALFGPGIVLPGLGVQARRLTFIGIFGLFIFRHVLTARTLTLVQLVLLATITCMGVLWGAAIPATYGFALGDSLTDILPWTSLLLLVFIPWDAWPRISMWNAFSKFVVRLSVLLAILHIAVWTLLQADVISTAFLSLATYRLTGGAPDEDSFVKAAIMGDKMIRVYWSSSVFMLCGLYFHVVNATSRWRIGWIVIFGILAFALFVTQIRAFLAAAAIFVALPPLLRFVNRPFLTGPAGVLLIWTFAILSVSVAINQSLLQAIGLARDVSDVARVDQAEALLGGFAAHPLFGMGFGAYAPALVRSGEALFSYELVFYALLMKLGLIGIVALGVALFLSLNIVQLDRFARLYPLRHSYWVAFTAGFWFAGSTNPFVVNFVGMSVLVLLLVDARYHSEPESAG